MTHLLKSNIELTIREARVEDSKSIISYIKKIILESDNLTFEEGEFNPTVEAEKQYIKSINESSNQCFLLSLVDNKIVGNLSISNINRARLKHSGDLSITVLKEYWNQGVASSLMIEFIQWLETTNLTKINLKVKEDNIHAIKLYEKFGFIQEGIISRDFYIGGQYFNSICMGKEILN
jgi:RimJ/RimL family protein N-acetyltransferase